MRAGGSAVAREVRGRSFPVGLYALGEDTQGLARAGVRRQPRLRVARADLNQHPEPALHVVAFLRLRELEGAAEVAGRARLVARLRVGGAERRERRGAREWVDAAP